MAPIPIRRRDKKESTNRKKRKTESAFLSTTPKQLQMLKEEINPILPLMIIYLLCIQLKSVGDEVKVTGQH